MKPTITPDEQRVAKAAALTFVEEILHRLAQTALAAQHSSGNAIGLQLPLQHAGLRFITDHCVARTMLEAERTQVGEPAEAGQRSCFSVIAGPVEAGP